MKKLVSILLTLAVAVSLLVIPAAVSAADPTTVASSTMVFHGSLSESNGVYTGTIPMVDGAGEGGLGDGVNGFDVYAREGAKATYDKAGSGSQDYACGPVSGHDAYSTGGGWGSWYDPDCGDYEHYQLKLTDSAWALEYVSGDTAYAAPMSGTMDWVANYAAETDAGAYYAEKGTPESSGYALDNTCTGKNTGAGSWDMDWSWGSDYVPLQYPGFDVKVTGSAGDYTVTMTPAAAGAAHLTVDVPDIIAISVSPTSIDFGSLVPGATSAEKTINVQNVGTHKVNVDAKVTGASSALFQDNLEMTNDGDWSEGPWDNLVAGLVMDDDDDVQTRLTVPLIYPPDGSKTGTLLFTVEAV